MAGNDAAAQQALSKLAGIFLTLQLLLVVNDMKAIQVNTTVLPLFLTLSFLIARNIETRMRISKNKRHHRKVLLSSFHLNGHTLGFHLQTQKLEPPCTVQ